MMMSKEVMVGGGVLAALLVGGVAYAATRPAAAPAAASLSFTAGHRYEIDMVIPPNSTMTVGSAPSATAVQANLNAIASGAFSVVSAGVSMPSTTGVEGGFTFYVIVDALKAITVSQADLLSGTPAGTTITTTDDGLTAQLTASSSSSSSSSTSAGAAAPTSTSTSSSSSSTTSSSSTSTSSSTSSSPAAAPAATVVVGTPTGLASPGTPGTTGWTTTIILGPGSATVTAMPGDAILIKLPNGGQWAASGTSSSSGSTAGFPTSGSADFTGTYTSPVNVSIAWTLGGVAYSTSLAFTTGQTWDSASAFLITNDWVRISLSAADYRSLMTALAASATEQAAMMAAGQRLVAAGINASGITPAEAFRTFLLAGGPFDTPFAINVGTLRTWAAAGAIGQPGAAASSSPVGGVALPSDWPTNAGAAQEAFAEFQYTGTGLTLSALPFTLSGWVRVT